MSIGTSLLSGHSSHSLGSESDGINPMFRHEKPGTMRKAAKVKRRLALLRDNVFSNVSVVSTALTRSHPAIAAVDITNLCAVRAAVGDLQRRSWD